jgi:phenylalanyl-tRNA synthetase beta chain
LPNIICGASNIRTGLKVIVATVGAVLPNGLKIK